MKLILVAAALALAAASTGTTIPSLRALAGAGSASLTAGAFVALHVFGGLVASWLVARRTRRGGAIAVRRVATLALVASAGLDLALAALAMRGGVAALLALRFVEGMAHVTAVMTLMVGGADTDAARRPRRMTWLGMVLVIGLGGGLVLGGRAAAGHPRLALALAAVLAAVAALAASLGTSRMVVRQVAPAPGPSGAPVRAGAVLVPAVLVLGERFAFGLMSVALPMAALDRAAVQRIATVLGCFMLASIVAMPIMRGWAARAGLRRFLPLVLLLLALALASTPLVLTHPLAWAAWALVGGSAAAGIYTAGLVLVAELEAPPARLEAMALLHALGSAGHALGSLTAGAGMLLLPSAASPTLLVAGPGPIMVAAGGVGALLLWRRSARRPSSRILLD